MKSTRKTAHPKITVDDFVYDIQDDLSWVDGSQKEYMTEECWSSPNLQDNSFKRSQFFCESFAGTRKCHLMVSTKVDYEHLIHPFRIGYGNLHNSVHLQYSTAFKKMPKSMASLSCSEMRAVGHVIEDQFQRPVPLDDFMQRTHRTDPLLNRQDVSVKP